MFPFIANIQEKYPKAIPCDCNKSDLRVLKSWNVYDLHRQIMCENCNAKGLRKEDLYSAVVSWNSGERTTK